jgi:hypothetical protein
MARQVMLVVGDGSVRIGESGHDHEVVNVEVRGPRLSSLATGWKGLQVREAR